MVPRAVYEADPDLLVFALHRLWQSTPDQQRWMTINLLEYLPDLHEPYGIFMDRVGDLKFEQDDPGTFPFINGRDALGSAVVMVLHLTGHDLSVLIEVATDVADGRIVDQDVLLCARAGLTAVEIQALVGVRLDREVLRTLAGLTC